VSNACIAASIAARAGAGSEARLRSSAVDTPSARGATGPFAVEFDWLRVRPPLEVRSRRAGDRIALPGMTGRKSIQDLLVDRKVPWTERGGVPVVADRERILWVVGHAATGEAPITDETREALVLAFEPSDSSAEDR
jgi:tRNA(Ile)-lysidine synthetase-like protein